MKKKKKKKAYYRKLSRGPSSFIVLGLMPSRLLVRTCIKKETLISSKRINKHEKKTHTGCSSSFVVVPSGAVSAPSRSYQSRDLNQKKESIN
jgi:hypothetical protein